MDRKNLSLLLVILGGVLVVITFYLYITHPHPPSEVRLQQHSQIPNSYSLMVDKGGWHDTGIWVEPYKLVEVATVERVPRAEPFILAVDNTEVEADLSDGIFKAGIETVSTRGGFNKNAAHIDNRGRIYIKVPHEAIRGRGPLSYNLLIKPISSESIDKLRVDQPVASWTIGQVAIRILAGLGLLGIVLVVIVALLNYSTRE
jgi:hypothetical protein